MMAKRPWGQAVQNAEELFNLKRRVVLDLAAKTFSQKGYEQTTLADIAKELRIAKPTIYNYFASKDDILYEIHSAAIASLVSDANEAPNGSPDAQIRRFVQNYVRMITTDYGACISTAPMQAFKPETYAKLAAASKVVDDHLRRIIADGVRQGMFVDCDPKLTAAFIFGTMNWIPRWRPRKAEVSLPALEDQVIDFVLRSLRSPSPVSADMA